MDSNKKDDCLSIEGRKSQIEKHNLEIRDYDIQNQRGSFLDVPACSLAPCHSSMSTITGLTALSIGSRVPRPCQILRSVRTGGLSSHRATPSLLLPQGLDWISEEDQRILNIMVQRREAQIEAEDLSLSARNLWEKDRCTYNQALNEKQKQWNEYVQEKRKMEKMELERRKEDAENALKCQQAQLEDRIKERHARCERRHRDIIHKKRQIRGEVDADELFHKLRKDQLVDEEEFRSVLHINEVVAKEKRAEENLKRIKFFRDRRIKERCKKREKRMESAHLLRETLNQQFELWCEENERLLNSKLRISEYRAAKAVEWRRKMTQDKNYVKRLQHSHLMTQLLEEDKSKEIQARQELMRKENKIRNHLEKKEQTKSRSRLNALTTAHLRQKIKASFQLDS